MADIPSKISDRDANPEPSGRVFFGWSIVGFTFVTQFVAMGTLFYAYGVLLKPLSEALDADRFSVSLALSLQTVLAALLSPWVGKLIAEKSLRALMWTGAATMSVGFIAMGQAQHLWHLYVTFGVVLAASMVLIGPLPNNTLLANWFVKRRGTALGVSQLGISLSGTVIVPLTTWLVLEHGWRAAVTVFGIIPLVVLVPLIFKFAVRRPEDMGLFPDGDVGPDPETGQEQAAQWTMARAVRDRHIWQLVIILGPSFMGIGAVLLALHSHITDVGLSALQASSVVALTTLLAALAKPLFGTLADYMNPRGVMAISLLCQIVGVALILAFQSYPGLLAAAVFFGLGYGAVMPMWSVLLGVLCGRAAFSRVMGLMGPMTMPFTLAGLPFTAYVYDLTGSYLPAFAALIVGFIISLISLAMLRLPAERNA